MELRRKGLARVGTFFVARRTFRNDTEPFFSAYARLCLFCGIVL